MVDEVDKILAERPNKHGEFNENSRLTWEIMRALQHERNWPILTDGQRHALYMIAHKMGRIMAGDPNQIEHWEDIEGYAKCITNRMRNPVIPYDGNDVYAALAVGWNVTREEAKVRVQEIMYQRREEAASARSGAGGGNGSAGATTLAQPDGSRPSAKLVDEPNEPGTPDDGGHHAGAEPDEEYDEVDAAADELRRAVEEELDNRPH